MSIASLRAQALMNLAEIDKIEAAGGGGAPLQASAADLDILSRQLSRNGISLRAVGGRTKSADDLYGEISAKKDMDVQRRIELKLTVERLAAGFPI